jgi:hypothetical protein
VPITEIAIGDPVAWVLTDPDAGDALERLAADKTAIPPKAAAYF